MGVLGLLSPRAGRDWAARAFDLGLAASAATWGALRLVEARPSDRFAPTTLAIVALDATVALLFVVRAPAVREASPAAIAASLPSLVVAALALRLAPPPGAWPLGAGLAFAAGALVAIASLASLGRSFAVLPALRGVVTRGPYRVVRHPAYAGELAMVAACAVARADAIAACVFALSLATCAARVLAEERALACDAYVAYSRRVRWRLVPGLF